MIVFEMTEFVQNFANAKIVLINFRDVSAKVGQGISDKSIFFRNINGNRIEHESTSSMR